MAWQLLLTDRQGNPLGELRNASVRSLRIPLNGVPTLSFTTLVDNDQAPNLALMDKTLLQLWDYHPDEGTKTLRFNGPIVTRQKDRQAGGGSIAWTAAGAAWRLGHRLIGKSTQGATIGSAGGAIVDRGEMLGRIVDALNRGESTNIYTDKDDTGIRRGVITPSSSSFGGPWRYQTADSVFAELSGSFNGPDWEVAPVAPTSDSDGLQIGALNVASAFGSTKDNIAWEFGTGKCNVATWQDLEDSNTLMNRGVNLPSGFPDQPIGNPISISDADSIADRGLHEAVVPGDLTVDALRQSLTQEYVNVRSTPRRVISFTAIAEDPDVDDTKRRVHRYWDDFVVGDVMPFRAEEQFPVRDDSGVIIEYEAVKTVDDYFRLFAVELTPDETGVVTPALTLVQS